MKSELPYLCIVNAQAQSFPFNMKLSLFSFSCLLLQSILLLSFASSFDDSALLSFKYSISDDPFGSLASWNSSSHYCQWRGVTCSDRHKDRVIGLELGYLNLTGSISPLLSNLTFLQKLNLTSNSLQGVIPQSLSRCSRIKVIDFKGNNLEGGIPLNLSSCRNLRILRLSNNKLVGNIPVELSHLLNLTYLDVGRNNLEGKIPPSLGNLTSLFAIDLSQNSLSGEIPSTFGKLTSLAFLYLKRNSLSGEIPAFDNFTSLMYLDLSYNNLSGKIPHSLGNLSSLTSIDFTVNTLSGQIPEPLGKLPNLNELYLTGNSLKGPIPSFLGFLPSLVAFGASHNKLIGEIPSSLYNLSTLKTLGLADNQLVGTIPNDIGNTLPNLIGLYLYYNNFHGSIPMSLANASGLTDIELTGNSFGGKIPANLGNLKQLYWLDLDRNEFDARGDGGWSFLDSLTNCSGLQALSLDYNGVDGLGGVLPKSVANLSTELGWLALGGNQISGTIPAEIENLVNLNVLGMDYNVLSRNIPPTIGKLHMLQELYLSGNKFSGKIPDSFGNLTNLNKLALGDNALKGTIPLTLGNCQALRWLNFSYNQLTGTIPKEIVSIPSLTEFVDLSHNYLTGSLPFEIERLKNLVQFYVSENNLSGEIPKSIGECQLLNTLDMDGNNFQGTIPSSMSNLKGIQELDLSRNNLSGQIPKFLESFSFLTNLNLSFNNFEGEVPTKGIFKNSSAVSMIGNENLCGGDPKLHLQPCPNGKEEKVDKHHRLQAIIIATSVCLCFVILICMLVSWYWSHNKRTKTPSSDSMEEEGLYVKVSYSNIQKATDEFSSANLIGMGSFGSVYKGIMNFGGEKLVAIKVINLRQKGASKSFIAECNALRSVRHRNLIKILTSCSSVDGKGNDFKALVFEYMPNGSLDKWLHEERGKLSLEQRINIAIDVACALDYLHHHGSLPIVHCDLKPSNVLLDNDMIAHVGDFGLAKFLNVSGDKSSKSSIGLKGTIGYVAPEYGMTGKVSTEGDVYSYGILLLEMFTGIKPTDETMKEGINLRNFVEVALPAQVMDVADPCLLFQEEPALAYKAQECLVSLLQIGLSCSKEAPKARMQMRDVIREMEKIRDGHMETGINEGKSTNDKMEDEGPSNFVHHE